MTFEKIPPQASDIEDAILGAILIDKDCHDLIELIEPDMFYKDNHQIIYKAIQELHRTKKPIDILTVCDRLKTDNRLDEVGGRKYITELTIHIASGLHANEHYLILLDKYVARESIRLSAEISELCFSDTDIEEIEAKVYEFKNFIDDKLKSNQTGDNIYELAQISFCEAVKRIQDYNAGHQVGIPVGFADLQNLIGCWSAGDLILLPARPSMGKTAIALFMARKCARSLHKVIFFSIEMSKAQLTDRIILGEIDAIDPSNWKSGNIKNSELAMYEDKSYEVAQWRLIIDDRSVLRPSDISRMCKREKPDIIFIDYIQLMKANKGKKFESRNLEVGDISAELKAIAKEHHIPVIALSQLSRDVEKRGSKIPQLSDLRDSGSLEQDADLVIFPYRPFRDSKDPGDTGIMDLIVAKNRNGRVGEVRVRHNEYINNFFDDAGGMSVPDVMPIKINNEFF